MIAEEHGGKEARETWLKGSQGPLAAVKFPYLPQ